MKTFEIGIATLNRYDLLKESLDKYKVDFPETKIHIVDNGCQNIVGNNVYPQDINLGVACSWNLLCREIFKTKDYALIVNDDVYLGYDEYHINKILSKHNYPLFIRSSNSWSMFLISKELFAQIGGFDEVFYPAYYEDSDYIYRMKLAGINQVIDEELNAEKYMISGTHEKAPELVNEAMKTNKTRYVRKWGGLPLLETFTEPYGPGIDIGGRKYSSYLNRQGNIIFNENIDVNCHRITFHQRPQFFRLLSDDKGVYLIDFPGGPSLRIGDGMGNGKIERIVPYFSDDKYIIIETK